MLAILHPNYRIFNRFERSKKKNQNNIQLNLRVYFKLKTRDYALTFQPRIRRFGYILLLLWFAGIAVMRLSAQLVLRDTVILFSSRGDSGVIRMNGGMDQENTWDIGIDYHRKSHFQPMRYFRVQNLDSVPAFGPKFLLNNRGNWYSGVEMAEEALRGAFTDKEKAMSLFRFVRDNRIHYMPAEDGNLDETHEPVRLFGIYGYGLCDDAAYSFLNLAHNQNIGAIEWGITAHNIAEVVLNNQGQIVDGDIEVYYPILSSSRLASKDEINRDRYLVSRVLHHGRDIPYDPSYSRHVASMFTNFDGMLYRNPVPHELYYNLLPGQSVTFSWERPDYPYEHRIWGMPTTELMFDHHIGNAFWDLTVDPSHPGYAFQFHTTLNLRADTASSGPDLTPLNPGSPAVMIHKVAYPFPQLDHKLFYNLKLPSGDDSLWVEWSTDSVNWVSVLVKTGPFLGADSCSLYNQVLPQVNPAIYSGYIRLTLHQADSNHIAGLDSLRFQTRTQNSKSFLPRLTVGDNSFQFSRKDSVTGHIQVGLGWTEFNGNSGPVISAVPVYPGAGITTDTAHLYFRWGNGQDPDSGDFPVQYHFQLSDRMDMRYCLASNFDRLIDPVSPSIMAYPAFKPEVNGFLQHGQTYYWRVRAMDNRGLWGPWTPVWSFTVHSVMPPALSSLVLGDSALEISWIAGMPGKIPARYAVYGSDEMSGFTPDSLTFIGYTQDSTWKFPYHQNPIPAYFRIVALDVNGEASAPSECIHAPFPFVYTYPRHLVFPDSLFSLPLEGNHRYYSYWAYFYPDTIPDTTWISPIQLPPLLNWNTGQSTFTGMFDSTAVRKMIYDPSLRKVVYQVLAPYSSPVTQTIYLDPALQNRPPLIEPFQPPQTGLGLSILDTLYLLDGDTAYGDSHYWNGVQTPAWMNLTPANGYLIIQGTPDYTALSDTLLTWIVMDSQGLTDTLEYGFHFSVLNTPPLIISQPDTMMDLSLMYQYSLQAFDPDTVLSDSVIFSLQQGPSWLNFNPTIKQLWGFPLVSPFADSLVTIRATDLYGDWTEQTFILHYKKRTELDGDTTNSGVPDQWVGPWEEGAGEGIHIFPNPADDQINIRMKLPENGHIRVSILTADGKELQEVTSGFRESGIRQINTRLQHLPAGIYLVRFEYEPQNGDLRRYLSKMILTR